MLIDLNLDRNIMRGISLICLIELCCLFSLHNVYAQFNALKFKSFVKENGLSSSNVTSVAQTPDGYLWIGTSDGLNRFDGYTFTVYRNDPHDSTSLSDNNITTLFVDSKGDLWIGTQTSGLSRYIRDKDNFKNYSSRTHEASSISSYYVKSIAEDADHQLWIATTMGLNKYDPAKDSFQRYFHEISIVVKQSTPDSLVRHHVPDHIVKAIAAFKATTFNNTQSFQKALSGVLSEREILIWQSTILKYCVLKITADHIAVLRADSLGNLWMTYDKIGLGFFNPRSNVLKLYNDPHTDGFWNKEIRSLYVDRDFLWIGTRDGELGKLSIANDILSVINIPFQTYNIESVISDSKGKIWFGDDYGLCRIMTDENVFYRYQNEENNLYSLPTTAVKVIFEDVQKNIWIGCAFGGLSLTISDMVFEHYKHYQNSNSSLSKNSVSSVLEDSKGNIWIGYFTMGIDRINKDKTITRFEYNPSNSGGIGKGSVFEIFEDDDGTIWIGTYEGGLQYFDAQSNSFVTIKNDIKKESTITTNDVRAIAEDNEGNLWIAIHGQGVARVDGHDKSIKHYYANYDDLQHSLANDWVFTLIVDKQNNVWVGSVYGLSVLYEGADNFVTYNRDNNNLGHNMVKSLLEDRNGNIWVGTENGLNLFDKKKKSFTLYNDKSGLPNNVIHAIQQDGQGNLWISTNNGLSRFNSELKTFINYSVLDGLQSNEFFPNASCRSKSGRMLFGGCNGLNIFDPNKILADSSSISVHFSGLSLFNKPVKVGSEMLPVPLDQISELTFASNQNVFSISFVGLSYRHSEKIHYAYKLEGFETQWNYVGSKHEATYTNLDPGTYTFKVKAANIEGVWNDHAQVVKVVVRPPFWKTPVAYIIYVLFVLSLLYLLRRTIVYREHLRGELRLQQLEAQKTHEMDSLKLKFFTNISHEFRTPLTLIIGPSETLIQGSEAMDASKRNSYFQLIHRNAQRMLRLINQLLDISALDAGFMKLRVGRHDIIAFCRNIAEAFQYRADNARLQYRFESDVDSADVYFDYDIVEKVLYNLISNAIKFTNEGGKVLVRLNVTDGADTNLPPAMRNRAPSCQFIKLEVEDNGIGIPSSLKEKVFERFYQAENNKGKKNGTGIGLALAKQLVERHYGNITVQSEEGRGCVFTVWLPVSASCFSTDEIQSVNLMNTQTVKEKRSALDSEMDSIEVHDDRFTDKQLLGNPIVLIVEDSNDIRSYVYLNLQGEYNVYEASNGEIGFKKALELNPDLIISDVIMPLSGGFELCEKIKNHPQTSHIPVILLTARSSEGYELEGLRNGADDYIAKPFSLPVLKARIKNIIEARQKIKDKFYGDLNFEPKNVASNQLDKGFMNQLITAIEANISDENFNPDILAEQLHVSRSQLYKKVKGLTGLSVSIFTRNIRLRKAAVLLQSNTLSISEVAYHVGFSDPGYFTKCFREMYSKSPSEYLHDQLL
jgi:signal transduction histidine kinase/ligand-binding sensor domain-containing protein/DNA-binding response OmpR family regulator